MRHGIHLAKGQKCHLVIQVVRRSTQKEKGRKRLVREGSRRDGIFECSDKSRSLQREHHGNEDESAHGREDGVQILGIQVLPDFLSRHGLFGEDATKTAGYGEDFSEEECIGGAGNDGLGGLDNVSEGNGTGAESDDGSHVDAGVAESNGEEGLEIGTREFGGLAQSESPEGGKVEDARGHLDSGDGPWKVEGVESLFVVDVVSDVEEVPEGEVGSCLESDLGSSAAAAAPPDMERAEDVAGDVLVEIADN
ncbi:hypothetical protein ACHAWX_006657 [Stephanocyclus meneghinianus]